MDKYTIAEEAYKKGYIEGSLKGARVDMVPDYGIVRNIRVYGIEESICRAKYPMATDVASLTNELTPGIEKLARSPAGCGHDQWLTGVIVQFDLTFTVKAWTELERYHFIDFVSSQSTMHRITKFDLENQYCPYVDPDIVQIMKDKVAAYNKYADTLTPEEAAEWYLEILYSNPVGFTLTAGMTTNYRQLKTIYAQRKDHRLPEWREFCRFIETLPRSELITGKGG